MEVVELCTGRHQLLVHLLRHCATTVAATDATAISTTITPSPLAPAVAGSANAVASGRLLCAWHNRPHRMQNACWSKSIQRRHVCDTSFWLSSFGQCIGNQNILLQLPDDNHDGMFVRKQLHLRGD